MDLIDYLANFNGEFNASLGETGGYITFSNSGRRGNVKCFQISLDSLKKTIEDILNNLHVFENIQDYVEKNWRDNGSAYFTDEVANAMITVQTKPLFSTLSKLIKWGNEPILNSVDDTQKIIISQEALKNTLAKLADTILQYSPQKMKRSVPFNFPLQQIFYGAPGTGKSYKVNELTKGDDTVIRTTFHPDSDYASFVGCYKPVTKEDKPLMQVVADFATRQAISIPVLDSAGNTVYDTSITYQFTQQAFLKAYIQAWEKMCKNNHSAAASSITTVVPPVGSVSLSFPVKSITYTIIEVTSNCIRIKREFDLAKNSIKNVWDSLWTFGDFTILRGRQSGRSVQIAVCRWIYDQLDNATKDSFDDGWSLLIDKLKQEDVYVSVGHTRNSQVYTVTKIEDNDESVHISNVASSKRARLKKCFEGTKPDGVEIGLIDVLKRINSENFDDAWEGLTEKIKKGENEYSDIQDVELIENKEDDGLITDPQYLVIEEINRGNCAQIFGDIFQLLDRNDWGFSTYPITADEDLRKELREEFNELNLNNVKDYVDSIFSENYPNGIVDKIKSGELLVLPCNLNLLATMNTSDQSLFPMDSAFKRRWDWEYVAITNAEKNWQIEIDDKPIDWWTFLQSINKVIADLTSSEDKQLGYFFTKPDEFVEKDETKRAADAQRDLISAKRFVSKVIFYLWNDVFKDYGFEPKCCKDDAEKEVLYAKFYAENGKDINLDVLKRFFMKLQDENGNPLLEP